MNYSLLRQHLHGLRGTFSGLEALPREILYLMGCRGFEQFCCTIRDLVDPATFCPFCTKELLRRKRSPLFQGKYWGLYKNAFPHKGIQEMLLVVPIRHIVQLTEITIDEAAELPRLFVATELYGGIQDGGIMWRFGNPLYNAGTVRHTHINIIKPTPGSEYRPPFAKKLSEHTEDYERLIGFRDELQRRGYDWLFSPYGLEATQPAN